MAADHPERVAAWLGETFGGPKTYTEQYGGYPHMVAEHIGKALTEPQRARWVRLLGQAADEAGLPTDPEFRSAFASYIEWGSRIAVENSQPGASPPRNMPRPTLGLGAGRAAGKADLGAGAAVGGRGDRAAGGGGGGELRGANQAVVSRHGSPVDALGLRPMVLPGCREPRRRDSRTTTVGVHAVRRGMERGEGGPVSPVDRDRQGRVTSSAKAAVGASAPLRCRHTRLMLDVIPPVPIPRRS